MDKYRQCQCGFWITSKDRYCPNCGNIPLNLTDPFILSNLILFTSILIILGLSSLLDPLLLFLYFFLFLPIGASVFYFLYYEWYIPYKQKMLSFFSKNEADIINELGQLETQGKSIMEIKGRIMKEGTEEKLKPILQKLDKAFSIIQSRRNLIEVKLWRIELVRWLNTLKPIISDCCIISTHQECDECLNKLEEVYNNGKNIVQQWKKRKDLESIYEGQEYIKSAQEALESCKELIDELLAKKARFTIQSIKISETLPDTVSSKTLEEIYQIMAVAEVQGNGINKIIEDMQAELDSLEIEQELKKL